MVSESFKKVAYTVRVRPSERMVLVAFGIRKYLEQVKCEFVKPSDNYITYSLDAGLVGWNPWM